LSLDLELSSHRSVEQWLTVFFAPENALDGFRCGGCGTADSSTKSLSIATPPPVLMLHLKRLVVDKKINRQVDFQAESNISPYIGGQGRPLKYELIGVLVHKGDHKRGHYIAFTKRENTWRCHAVMTLASSPWSSETS